MSTDATASSGTSVPPPPPADAALGDTGQPHWAAYHRVAVVAAIAGFGSVHWSRRHQHDLGFRRGSRGSREDAICLRVSHRVHLLVQPAGRSTGVAAHPPPRENVVGALAPELPRGRKPDAAPVRRACSFRSRSSPRRPKRRRPTGGRSPKTRTWNPHQNRGKCCPLATPTSIRRPCRATRPSAARPSNSSGRTEPKGTSGSSPCLHSSVSASSSSPSGAR